MIMQAYTAPNLIPAITPWRVLDTPPLAAAAPQRCMHVNIGELRVGGAGDQLQALLGSCVGIAVLWKRRGRCALAHCLLPQSPIAQYDNGARYVSQAVPSLLRMIGACSDDYAELEVVLAGGGTMLEACSARFQIGQQNIDAAEKYLHQYGLRVRHIDVGGNSGRTMTVDGDTLQVQVEAIRKPVKALHYA